MAHEIKVHYKRQFVFEQTLASPQRKTLRDSVIKAVGRLKTEP